MIVGVDIREWQPGRRTGIGRVLEEFLRTAVALRPRDRFVLIGNATCEIRVRAGNCAIVRIPERWTPWWDQITLARAVAAYGADVLYSPYIKIPLRGAVPVVNTIHDLTFFRRADYNVRRSDLLKNPPFRLFCRLAIKRASVTLVDSQASAQDVQWDLQADPAKLRVVPLATGRQFYEQGNPADDRKVWERYGLSAGYVFYIGGFWPHKNVTTLVRAYAALPESLRRQSPLVLAGTPVPADLHRLIRSREGCRPVAMIGMVPDEDLPALYRGAALFAFPSHYEGFGLPVLEAMACGVPVLCSTTPALVELTGDAAEHVNPENDPAWEHSLQTLLEDTPRRQRLAESGRARAALFTVDRMTEAMLKVFDEVAAGRT